MKAAERDKALELRIKYKLGYGTIAKQLSVSKGTLSRWLKDLPLSSERVLELRREGWSRGEAKREVFRQTMRKKRDARENALYGQIKNKFNKIQKQSLFVAGLMLYQAEGDKKDNYHIGLANTDAEIIKFFLWWLEMFLNISRSRIRMQLHLYEDMDLSTEKKYWQKETGLPERQFYRDQVRPIRPGSFSYSESFRHGTCKIYFNGVKEKTELSLSIKAFFDTYRGLRV